MKLAYIAPIKVPSKINELTEKFQFIAFKKSIMKILSYLTTLAVGINLSTISIEQLLSRYAFDSFSWTTVKNNIAGVLEITHETMFYSAQIFSLIIIIGYFLSSMKTDSPKACFKNFLQIIGGTILYYVAFVFSVPLIMGIFTYFMG